MRRLPLLPIASMTIVAGCSHQRVAVVPPPVVRTVAVAQAAPQPPAPLRRSPINSNLSAAATVWHLRAALNVAALACRGTDEAAIIAGYNTLLRTQKTALAAAQTSLSAEYRAAGGDWQDRYDDSMTRLYNFFSQAPARDRFCAVAGAVLADSAGVMPEALPAFAADRLARLDAPFAALLPAVTTPAPVMAGAPVPPRPVVALAANPAPRRVATSLRPIGPAPTMLATGAHPILTLDLKSLPAD